MTVQEVDMQNLVGKKVLFYGTCLVDLTAPSSGLAAIKILEKIGHRVFYPPNQTCCSQPAFNSGYRKAAKSVAQKQLNFLDAECPIVVPSGSCAAMLKHHLTDLFSDDLLRKKQAEKISKQVFEWADFVDKSCQASKTHLQDRGKPSKVVLHISCHARREMQVAMTTKRLLQQLKNVELLEIPDEEVCCGFGGTFSIKHSDISAKMLQQKINAIEKASPDYLISTDIGCLLQLEGMLKKNRKNEDIPKTIHLADFLWQRVFA